MRLLLTRFLAIQSIGTRAPQPQAVAVGLADRAPPLRPTPPEAEVLTDGHIAGLPTAPPAPASNERLWRQCSQLVGEGNPATSWLDLHTGPQAAPAFSVGQSSLAGARRGAARGGGARKLTNRGHQARRGSAGDRGKSRGRAPGRPIKTAERQGGRAVGRSAVRGDRRGIKRCVRALVESSFHGAVASFGVRPSTFLPPMADPARSSRGSSAAPAPHRLGGGFWTASWPLGVVCRGVAVQQHQRTAGGQLQSGLGLGPGLSHHHPVVFFLLLLWSLWQAWQVNPLRAAPVPVRGSAPAAAKTRPPLNQKRSLLSTWVLGSALAAVGYQALAGSLLCRPRCRCRGSSGPAGLCPAWQPEGSLMGLTITSIEMLTRAEQHPGCLLLTLIGLCVSPAACQRVYRPSLSCCRKTVEQRPVIQMLALFGSLIPPRWGGQGRQERAMERKRGQLSTLPPAQNKVRAAGG